MRHSFILRFKLRKGGRFYALCWLAIVLTMCLSIVISAFFDSMLKTQEQSHISLYGAWHVAVYQSDAAVRQQLREHALVETAGEISAYGQVLAKEGLPIGLWGTVDKPAASMGQLTLSAGRLPAADGEIAIEADKMEQLGWKKDRVGQMVALTMQGDGSGPELRAFRLVGVIDDYTQFWKEGRPYLPSFIVHTPEQGTAVFTSLLCQLKEKNNCYSQDLLYLAKGHGEVVLNDYAFNSLTPRADGVGDNSMLLNQSVLQVICMAVLSFVLYCLLMVSLKEREKSFSFMCSIGASCRRILRIYLAEISLVTAAGILAGIVWGCLLAGPAIIMAKNIYGQNLMFALNSLSVLLNVAVVTATVFLTVCITLFFFTGIKRPAKSSCERPVKKFRHNEQQRLGLVRMKSNFNRAHIKETVLSAILMCCICTGLAGTTYYAYDKYDTYNRLAEEEPFDYMYGYDSLLAKQTAWVPVTEAERLQSSYGVGEVQAYSYLTGVSAQWDERPQTQYGKTLTQTKQAAAQVELFGLLDNWQDGSSRQKNNNVLPVNTALLEGNSVLIYLPDFCVTDENRVVFAHEEEFELLKNIYPVYQETAVRPGDRFTLSHGGASQSVTVAGVMRGFEPQSAWGNLAKPYTVFAGRDLIGALDAQAVGRAHFIQLTASPSASRSQMTEVLSGMLSELDFYNIARLKQDAFMRANFTMAVIVAMNMLFLLCFLMIWRGGVIPLSAAASRQRVQLLSVLGMKRSALFALHIWNTAVASILAGVVAFLVILLCESHIYFSPLSYSAISRTGIFEMWNLLLTRFFQQVSWQAVVWLFAGFVALNLIRAGAAFFHKEI